MPNIKMIDSGIEISNLYLETTLVLKFMTSIWEKCIGSSQPQAMMLYYNKKHLADGTIEITFSPNQHEIDYHCQNAIVSASIRNNYGYIDMRILVSDTNEGVPVKIMYLRILPNTENVDVDSKFIIYTPWVQEHVKIGMASSYQHYNGLLP